MKLSRTILFGSFIYLFSLIGISNAGTIYQNFELGNSASLNTWVVGGSSTFIQTVGRTEAVHLGVNALKYTSADYWSGFGVKPRTASGEIDLKQTNNDRLTFWTYAMPKRNCYTYGCEQGTDNNVGVVLYDNGAYVNSGFEVWTTQTARYGQWTKLKVLFSQLPADFDLSHVSKIEFKNYLPGKYYFDDIHAVREERAFQTFEKEQRSGSTDNEYGWKWNDADTAAISVQGDPVFEGSHSWKLALQGKWGGTGIQSQEKKYYKDPVTGNVEQTFWRVDLAPENNDRLIFWVYGLPQNGMDNNLAVQFYDNGKHATDDTKVVVWTKKAAVYGQWTRMTVLFSDVLAQAADFNLKDVNKIQFQSYWPGQFYIDVIEAVGPQTVILQDQLGVGLVQWRPVSGARNYRLQESTSGPQGPWKTIYSGTSTAFKMNRVSKSWLRVRWEESFLDRNSLPYASGWSEVTAYLPAAIVFNYKSLQAGRLQWTPIPQTSLYEVQQSLSKDGPWTVFYRGPVTTLYLTAVKNKWYRLRAVRDVNGSLVDSSAWSRPQRYWPEKGFVRATGTIIKDEDGTGAELVLKGVNFGGGLVNEPWMTGVGTSDVPALDDDWSVCEKLSARFGNIPAAALMSIYREAYFNTYDFDRLLDQGITLVRLPFYYRNLQDDQGNWIRDARGQIDFTPLDRIVDALADRGIYTLIDMHGAPGLQSTEATTGRKGFNKLFAADGEVYRARTEEMWKEIATHYRNNTWVLGYDLLNEPLGAGADKALLANVYDRLYKAIRAVDQNHLIMMEGIWYPDPADPDKKRYLVDWDTLPLPSEKGWTNIAYQFHFYHWDYIDASGNKVSADEHFDSHKAFIDQKIAEAAIKQPLYNVPVMIGEFYGFGLKTVWDYYIQHFNTRKWSWTSWSYKNHNSSSNWGMVNHANYDDTPIKIASDTYLDLVRKFSKYTTANYHVANVSVESMVSTGSGSVAGVQAGTGGTGMTVASDGTFTFSGVGLGDTPGTFQFYPKPCQDVPPGSVACNYGDAAITYWSDSLIKGVVPPDAADLGGRWNIHSQYGGELYPTMIGANGLGSDLVPKIIIGPLSARPGQGIFLSYIVANKGSAFSGDFSVSFYLSQDAHITTTDQFIARRYQASLGAGAFGIGRAMVTLPAQLSTGSYYFGLIVDDLNKVTEMVESNNTVAGNRVNIR